MKFSIIYEAQSVDTSREAERKLFTDLVEQCVLADELGFDGVWAVEHTALTQYAHMSAPETFLTKTPHKKVWTHRRSTKVAFLFSASTVGATFQCSIDGKAFAACTPGHRFRLKLGKHTFAVRAVAQGLVDATPATFKVRVRHRARHTR